jgi:hypothetical protein
MAVERMRNCEDVGALARELRVTARCLYKWRAKLDLLETGEESARPSTHESSYRKQAQRLKRLLAEKVVTYYRRLLNYIVPDRVHVLVDGRIVRSGGPELALQLEDQGYTTMEAAGRSASPA